MEMTQARETVDNFELIDPLLNFEEPNTFYFVQILKRRKENPDMKTGVRTINIYYLYSKSDLVKLKPKIVEDCQKNNARAYISLNRLDAYVIALYTQKIIIEHMIGGQFFAVKNAYTTACGNYHSDDNAKWVIDIDIVDKDGNIDSKQIELSSAIVKTLMELHNEIKRKNYKILATLPTKNGHHIITNPFNTKKFGEMYPDTTFYKNSPTILYI
jgi:hypothetical protein